LVKDQFEGEKLLAIWMSPQCELSEDLGNVAFSCLWIPP